MSGAGVLELPLDPRRVGQKVVIDVEVELSPMLDAAEDALLADWRADQAHGVYARGGHLAHVIRENEALDRRGLKFPKGEPRIRIIEPRYLTERLDRAATFIKEKKGDGEKPERVQVRVPGEVAGGLCSRGDWTLMPLDAVVTTPILRPDMTVAQDPGYDEGSRTLLILERAYPRVPAMPTPFDAAKAYKLLCDPLTDFPFREPTDRAAAICALLTILARAAIRGPVPMFAFGAPTPGSGKTLAAVALTCMASGTGPALMSPPDDKAETEKQILMIAMEGTRVVLLDNVVGDFGNGAWSAALTSPTGEIGGRILSMSKSWHGPLRAVFLLSGNNVSYVGDVPRRVIPIDLAPAEEHPEDRTGFRYPHLFAHVAAHHPEYVAAGLTILRAHQTAGAPRPKAPTLGSYEAWDFVRSAVWWASDGVDPVAGQSRIRQDGDPVRDSLRELLSIWKETFPTAVTVSDLVTRATPPPEREATGRVTGFASGVPELANALAALDKRRGDPTDLRRSVSQIGMGLKRIANRPVSCDGEVLVLRRMPGLSRARTAMWKVEVAT